MRATRTTRTFLAGGVAALVLAACKDGTGPNGSGPKVGDAVTYNTAARGAGSACEVPDNRTGRVVAVTQRAVVVADNANPTGGFTDAEYAAIAQEFDNLAYPVDVENFGAPFDMDDNQRVVIFFTRAVNELTPAGGEAVTGGFFHPRDLFERLGPNPGSTDDDCPTSNEAEMFYMLVPDPNGEVNGNVRTKASVRRQTVGVLAHEFQHLINASRALNNGAESFEEVWLNEGLSHIAEELLFYRASGLAPKQNISLATLRSSQTILDAVNAYQVSNIGRLIEYLENPEQRSPYTALTPETDPIDDLATRGAAWQLLRYAADRSTASQQTIWMNLVNAKVKGIPNFTSVFGGNFVGLVRDWAVAQYTDDAVTTAATFQHPSWNYRSIVPALLDPQTFPLRTRTLTADAQVSLTLNGGGAAYLRFGVAAGATGRITATSSGAALPGSDPPAGVLSLSVGEVRTLSASQGSAIEVSGGSGGGEFVLIPFHGSEVAADQVALEFTGTQITGVTGPPNPYVAPASRRQLSLGSSTEALRSATSATSASRFDLSLRRLEREMFGPRLAARHGAVGPRLSPLRSISGASQVSFTVVRTK